MRIYIIRHGQTDLNASAVRQSVEGQLSQEGIAQARLLGERLSSLPVDTIFTSPYPRAKQTADIITSFHKNLLVQESEYLVEVRYPSEIFGKPKDDPRSIRIINEVQDHFGDSGWRHSDEETFDEFVGRAHTVLEYIAKTGFENAVVVSHERFIRVLVGVILLGSHFTPEVFRTVREKLYVSNSGVTISEQGSHGAWRLMTLNDHSHLEPHKAVIG